MSRGVGGAWEVVREGIGNVVVEHAHYVETKKKLLRALKTKRLVLLVGASGVGKTTLVREVVRELNEGAEDDPLTVRAVCMRAPSAHGTRYGWKDFYRRWGGAVGEPLIDRKVNRMRITSRSSADRSPSSYLQGNADVMRNSVFRATIERGVEVVFVDEAANLVPNEQGRTPCDQLDILRDLSDESSEAGGRLDKGSFSIVLFSTFRIVTGKALELSPELIRRMKKILFPRYDHEAAVGSEDFLAYRDIVNAFLGEIPEELRPVLSEDNLREFLRRSVGCVGLLREWLLDAICACEEEGAERLAWGHFGGEAGLTDGDVRNLIEWVELGESSWEELVNGKKGDPSGNSRTRGAVSKDTRKAPSGGGKRGGGRKGLPGPGRLSTGLQGE